MKKLLCYAGILCLLLTSCGNAEEDNTYHWGTDNQYFYNYSYSVKGLQAKGESGYFLFYDNFLYYYDDAIGQVVPLCNRADCMHDKDPERNGWVACNAFTGARIENLQTADDYFELNSMDNTGIEYSDGYLYFLTGNFSEECHMLYRIREDGSERELIYEFGDENIYGWCIHRGYCYYSAQSFVSYFESGEQIYEQRNAIKRIPVSGSKEPETIFVEEKENKSIMLLSLGQRIIAYGSYIYFEDYGVKTLDWDVITEENAEDYEYIEYYAYNYVTGELHEISTPGMPEYEGVQEVTFWQDSIVFASGGRKISDREVTYYIADLDGSNVREFMTVDDGMQFVSDGTYLYLTNQALQSVDDTVTETYWVYDQDLELVDTFTIESPAYHTISIGDEKFFFAYSVNKEEGSWKIRRYDKSAIGSLNGKELKPTVISERKLL
ncbi:MAG: hypothetical protein NC355_08480 [Blautia sp.]|nr:hypothetical protein [Blautia sp.]